MPGQVPDLVETLPPDPEHPFGELRDGKMRAFCVAYAAHGSKTRAAKEAGISASLIYTRRWREDDEFQAAMARAYMMSADELETEARRRAVDGVRQYKYDRDGNPLRHPTMCECGHSIDHHPRPGPPPSDGSVLHRPCRHPDCDDCYTFEGEAYYEHSFSDTLLKFLLTGAVPDRYSKRTVEFRGLLAKLDLTKLPDAIVDRIASGDNPLEVLAAAAAEAGQSPSEYLGVEVGELTVSERAALEASSDDGDPGSEAIQL